MLLSTRQRLTAISAMLNDDRFESRSDGRKVLQKKSGKRPGKRCGGSFIAAEKQCKSHKSNGKLTEAGKKAAQELAEKVRARKGLKSKAITQANQTKWTAYDGKQPWQAERNKYGQSINEIAKPIKGQVFKQIEEHPSFADLKKKIDRSLVSIYGKGKAPENDAEQYLTHTEYNSKTKKSQEIAALQSKILNDLGLKAPPSKVFRGNQIDWHKAAVKVAMKEGYPVSANVLKSFGLSNA